MDSAGGCHGGAGLSADAAGRAPRPGGPPLQQPGAAVPGDIAPRLACGGGPHGAGAGGRGAAVWEPDSAPIHAEPDGGDPLEYGPALPERRATAQLRADAPDCGRGGRDARRLLPTGGRFPGPQPEAPGGGAARLAGV